jgi:two-component system chemotaxis sensor kinase CheA
MLSPVLRAAGYEVTSVASGEAALALLQSDQRFDIVITDIEMPGMSGIDLASSLRSNPRTAEVPVIGLSSAVSSQEAERGRLAGMRDCVTKFDRRGLIAALKQQAAEARCA